MQAWAILFCSSISAGFTIRYLLHSLKVLQEITKDTANLLPFSLYTHILFLQVELDWMRRQPQARESKSKARIDAFYKLDLTKIILFK